MGIEVTVKPDSSEHSPGAYSKWGGALYDLDIVFEKILGLGEDDLPLSTGWVSLPWLTALHSQCVVLSHQRIDTTWLVDILVARNNRTKKRASSPHLMKKSHALHSKQK